MVATTSDEVFDAALNKVATCDVLAACAGQPLSYYEAKDHAAWAATTVYSLGAGRRPIVRNGYAYEVTTAGTSGGAEPSWPTTPGATIVDGTVTWTCRANYALADIATAGGDFTNANGDISGRKVTTAQKANATIHTSGSASHVAKTDAALELLLNVHTCTVQALTEGGTVTFPAHDAEFADPT